MPFEPDEVPEEDWEGIEDYDQTTPLNGHAFDDDDPTDEDALDWRDEDDDDDQD